MKFLACTFVISLCVLTTIGCTNTSQRYYGPARTDTIYLSAEALDNWFNQARMFVELERGVDLSAVTLVTQDDRGFLFALSEQYGKLANPSLTRTTRTNLFSGSALRDAPYVLALYDPFSKFIVLNKRILALRAEQMQARGIGLRETVMTVLLHELAHAADDRQFNFQSISHKATGGTLGLVFIAEGRAERQTQKLCI